MNKIVWEKYEPSKRLMNKPQDDDDHDEDEVKPPSLMQTPFGMFRVDDSMNPFKQFKFWIGNTNFAISPRMVDVLNKVSGVETLVFLTRYRFIVGVGQLFTDTEVLQSIEDKLSGNKVKLTLFSDNEVNKSIEKLREDLDKITQYWSIYVFPNGNIDYFQDKEYEGVWDRYRFYRKAQKYSSGQIIISSNMKRKLDDEANNKSRI